MSQHEDLNSPGDAAWLLMPVQQQIMAAEHAHLSQGAANGPLLINASNDRDAIARYLTIRCAKNTTRNAVKRDLRKFAVFMHLRNLKLLSDVKAEHCSDFQQWLMAPDPDLCSGKDGRPPGLTISSCGHQAPNPAWKPFRAPLSPVSTNQTIDKIKSLYAWLVKAGYLSGNPWLLIAPITKASTTTKDETEDGDPRELPIQCIKAVLHYLDHGAGFAHIDARRFAHWRWIFHFYLYTAARLSSGCTATLDDIYRDRKGNNQLTLTVKGTGIRRKDVPWIPELEAEYLRYRTSIGLSLYSLKKANRRRQPNEPPLLDQGPRHLLLPLTANEKTSSSSPLSYHSIHGHIVDLFRVARAWAIETPALQLEDWQLAILEDATGHWIRHGTATLLGIHAKSQLGHSSFKQTDAYQAKEVEQHRHRLRHLTKPEEPPYQALLNEPLAIKVSWMEKLMASIEAEDAGALDDVWSGFCDLRNNTSTKPIGS